MVVPIEPGLELDIGVPQVLFQTFFFSLSEAEGGTFGVSKDGQRILLNTRITESASPPITVVLDWAAELEQ